MKIFKIKENSVPISIIIGSIIIGLSIFLTTWVFFGGYNNKQKLSVKDPRSEKVVPKNTLTPEQIKIMQEQRAAQLEKASQSKAATTTQ